MGGMSLNTASWVGAVLPRILATSSTVLFSKDGPVFAKQARVVSGTNWDSSTRSPLALCRGDRVELSQFVPDTTLACFAKTGPSFENRTVEEVAKILGRTAPTQEAVFKDMPPMFGVQ